MKKLLPILLCYMLMTSQVFAISGGPVFGGGGINPVGTYSGIIQVTKELDYNNNVTIDPVTGAIIPSTITNVNALGLFALGVPTTSVAQGAFLIFVEGVVYNGTIIASVNPDSDRLNGIVNATFNYTLATGTTTTAVTAQANGQIAARISPVRKGSISSANINGTSTINVSNGFVNPNTLQFNVDRVLNCTVTGFRQSTTPSTITTLGTTTGT